MSVCLTIQQLGYPVKLDTNGSRPKVIEALLAAGAVDYIAMDIKSDPANYVPLIRSRKDPDAIVSSIELILHSGVSHEFRTTCINPLVTHSIVKRIAKLIEGADLYVLQQLQTTNVLDSGFCGESTRRYNNRTLELFRDAAAPMVKQCVIR